MYAVWFENLIYFIKLVRRIVNMLILTLITEVDRHMKSYKQWYEFNIYQGPEDSEGIGGLLHELERLSFQRGFNSTTSGGEVTLRGNELKQQIEDVKKKVISLCLKRN